MEQKKNNNPMIEEHMKGPVHDEYDVVGSFFSSSSSSDSEVSSETSLESDSFEEVTSQASSSSSSPDPLSDMSSLFQQLPLKRGLSKFYQGKSQSFTSLASVVSLEDLVKPENPYYKKLKSCKSYGGGFGERQGSKCTTSSTSVMSRLVSKRGVHSAGSRGSCSSLSARRSSTNFMGSSRPPIPSHRSSTSTTNIANQTALFA